MIFTSYTLLPMKDNLIVKHNDFLSLGYKLSLNEQRILLACISQVDSRNTLDQGMDFVIKVQEIKDIFGDQSATSIYADLRSAVDQLAERWIIFNTVYKKPCIWNHIIKSIIKFISIRLLP